MDSLATLVGIPIDLTGRWSCTDEHLSSFVDSRCTGADTTACSTDGELRCGDCAMSTLFAH